MSPGQTHCSSCGSPLTEKELGAEGYGPRSMLLCAGCGRASARQRRGRWLPVMEWEHGSEGLRLASKAPVPWPDSNVAMITVSKSGVVRAVHTRSGKLDLLDETPASDMILVAWPGRRRQDVFIVDDRRAARAALA